MGLPSSAAVPALSAWKGRAPSSARALNMAAAIGLRQMFAVQTKRTFFTRSLAFVGFRTLIQWRLGAASGQRLYANRQCDNPLEQYLQMLILRSIASVGE